MRDLANLVGMTALLVTTTVLFGWWSLPVVAAAWTYLAPRRAGVLYAAFAGALAWGVILLWYARTAHIGRVDSLLATILGVPSRSVIGLTLAYAALLAGSAALVAQSVRRLRAKSPRTPPR